MFSAYNCHVLLMNKPMCLCNNLLVSYHGFLFFFLFLLVCLPIAVYGYASSSAPGVLERRWDFLGFREGINAFNVKLFGCILSHWEKRGENPCSK